jgi:hypothetical protein
MQQVFNLLLENQPGVPSPNSLALWELEAATEILLKSF